MGDLSPYPSRMPGRLCDRRLHIRHIEETGDTVPLQEIALEPLGTAHISSTLRPGGR